MKKISIVTPVFQEEEGIETFYQEIVKHTKSIELDLEIIFCLDPSKDKTQIKIEAICAADKRAKMILFSKRIGQDLALMAGLEHAMGDCVILMDSDLQDPPNLIPALVESWRSGNRIVLAERSSRKGENFFKIWTSKMFYKFMKRFSDDKFPEGAGDFRLLDRKVVNEIIKFKEQEPFMRALMSMVGFESASVKFDRPNREIGVTKYSRFFGGYQIAFKTIINYSNLLLKLNLVVGLFVASFSLIFAVAFAIAKTLGADFASGVTTIVFSIWFLGGVILIGIGTVGLYIDKILNEVKSKPRYIISKSIGLTSDQRT